jgi:hypothetical protein
MWRVDHDNSELEKMRCKQPKFKKPAPPNTKGGMGIEPKYPPPSNPTKDKKHTVTISINIEGEEKLEQLKETLKDIDNTLDQVIEKSNRLNLLTASVGITCDEASKRLSEGLRKIVKARR